MCLTLPTWKSYGFGPSFIILPLCSRNLGQANHNKIPDLSDLEPQLGHIKTLSTLYLEGNPCELADKTGYRRKVMLAVPRLQQIDAVYVPVSGPMSLFFN